MKDDIKTNVDDFGFGDIPQSKKEPELEVLVMSKFGIVYRVDDDKQIEISDKEIVPYLKQQKKFIFCDGKTGTMIMRYWKQFEELGIIKNKE